MRTIKTMLLRTVAIAAFTGLTLGGSTVARAYTSGFNDTGYGNQETVEPSTGSGTGGSMDTGTSPDTGPPADTGYSGSSNYDQSSGAATGGSTERSDKTADHDFNSGTTTGGVTWPDHRDVLGPSGSDYWR